MAEFKIQRGSFDFGATEDTDTVTLATAVASLDIAFARVTSVRFASGGPTAGTGADRNNDDLGVTCLLTALDTITFTRLATGVNEDVRVYWEVIEGPAFGDNAIAVRYHDNVTMAAATGQQDQAVADIDDVNNCVPFVLGVTNADTGAAWDKASVTAEMIAGNVRLKRVDTADETVVSVAVVEFTGDNWIVENNIEHNYIAAGANEAQGIVDVADTTHAFVVCSHRCDGADNDELGYNCWFKDTNELYFRIAGGAGAPASDYTMAHVVRNDNMVVEHLDSITGVEDFHPAGAASPQSLTTTVAEVWDMAQASLFASADDSGAAVDYPQPFWLYRLTAVDEVTWWRGRFGTTSNWALQVVQWPSEKWRVRRGVLDFGATEDTDTATLAVPVLSLGVAFARITGIRYSCGGPTAGTAADRNNDDLGVTCLLTAVDTVTFTRLAAGANEDVRVYWEVIEGPPSGSNAAVVRYHDNVAMNAVGQVNQAVAGIDTLADCVPFICGLTSTSAIGAWDRASVTAKMLDVAGDKVQLDRVDAADNTVVSVAVVEFTGSGWFIENNIEHVQTVGGANQAKGITDVLDITHAFVVCAARFSNTLNNQLGYLCWFKDSDELYFRALQAGRTMVAHVVRNDEMTVEHLDSITGGEGVLPAGAADPQTETTTVAAVADMEESCLFATADCAGAATDYPQPHWLYRLTDTDEVTWWRARSGQVSMWTLDVVQLPEATEEDDDGQHALFFGINF